MGAAARDQFFSALYAGHLKRRGYRKVRHTFAKQYDSYGEHYQLQGSDWNDERRDWRFYINCGISFPSLPRRQPDLDFPRVHAWARAPHLVPSAQPQYDVSSHDPMSIVADVVAVIDHCSKYFARRHAFLLDAYARRDYRWPFLRDPELEVFSHPTKPANNCMERTREP